MAMTGKEAQTASTSAPFDVTTTVGQATYLTDMVYARMWQP